MRFSSIILLLSLVLLPIICNSVALFHFIVEHTHTFCVDETSHTHPSADQCLSIWELSQSPDQLPSPTNNDFQELKQYLTPMLSVASVAISTLQQGDFSSPHLLGKLFLKTIFYPPIFA